MKKRWLKMALAVLMAAITLLGIVGCGKVEMPQGIKEYLCVEHTYGPGEVERWATCIREGRVKHTCTECGHEKYETLTKVNHTPYTVPAREATCAQTGYTEHTACAVCGTVISGKQTTPKTTCLHADDYYVGMGVYACPLCKDERMEYQESIISDSSYFYQKPINEENAWYRFYIPKEGATASISFRNRADGIPMGNMEINEIYSLTIGFDFSYSTRQDYYITIGDPSGEYYYWCDVAMEIGADYIDVCLGEIIFELYHNGDCGGDEVCWFTLSEDKAKVVDVSVSGGAKIVLLQGLKEADRP